MTQGTQSISMAHRAALGCLAVARQLSVVVMVVSIIALVAGTAGTSYAKVKVPKEDRQTEQTVVVTNFGSLFAGTVETFAAGSVLNSGPIRLIKGSSTLLGVTGASGDSQSSLDGDIAVTIPLGIAGLCPAGCVSVFPAGASGNTAPEDLIGGPACNISATPAPPLPFCSRTFLGIPILDDNTGLFLDQGVAFDDPFRILGAHTTPAASISVAATDRFAVANFGQVVIASVDPASTTPSCLGPTNVPPQPAPTIGTITIYNSGDTGNVAPTPDFLTLEVPFPPAAPNPFWTQASIGGCDTALFGPIGVTFDTDGDLWVVDNLAKFVTEYAPGASGDAHPIDIVGLPPITGPSPIFLDPAYIAVGIDPINDTGHQVIYVSDDGDNSIKVLDVSVPFVDNLLGSIAGGHTKLKRPEGIALFDDDLYVANHNANSLAEFDDLVDTGLGNIRPKVLIKGPASKLNFPVGVAGPQFSPPVL